MLFYKTVSRINKILVKGALSFKVRANSVIFEAYEKTIYYIPTNLEERGFAEILFLLL